MSFVTDYPNLPVWISRSSIYAAWLAISSIGHCGYVLFRGQHRFLGLMLLAIYTISGLDGLLHYSGAPISAHSFGMNATIWTEVVTAALALVVVLSHAVRLLRSKAAARDRHNFL